MTLHRSLPRRAAAPLGTEVDHTRPGRSGAEEPSDGLVQDPSPFEVSRSRKPRELGRERRDRRRPRARRIGADPALKRRRLNRPRGMLPQILEQFPCSARGGTRTLKPCGAGT